MTMLACLTYRVRMGMITETHVTQSDSPHVTLTAPKVDLICNKAANNITVKMQFMHMLTAPTHLKQRRSKWRHNQAKHSLTIGQLVAFIRFLDKIWSWRNCVCCATSELHAYKLLFFSLREMVNKVEYIIPYCLFLVNATICRYLSGYYVTRIAYCSLAVSKLKLQREILSSVMDVSLFVDRQTALSSFKFTAAAAVAAAEYDDGEGDGGRWLNATIWC